MPKRQKFFVWEEAQAFLGDKQGHVLTSYTNNKLTISFEQDSEGNLTQMVWETEDESGSHEFETTTTTVTA